MTPSLSPAEVPQTDSLIGHSEQPILSERECAPRQEVGESRLSGVEQDLDEGVDYFQVQGARDRARLAEGSDA